MSSAIVELVVDLPYFSKFSATCAASSRVGSRMSVRGMRARARPFSRRVSIGRTKRRRLAGAGLGDAEHVAALEHVRDGAGLDRGRYRVAGVGLTAERTFWLRPRSWKLIFIVQPGREARSRNVFLFCY